MMKRFPAIAAVIAKYPPEWKLGNGAYKWVYASGNVAVAVTEYELQAREEIRYLTRLRAIGLPVVEVLEWVLAGRNGNGGAIVMRLYNKPYRLTNAIHEKCREIAAILRRRRIWVTDLHVLLDARGGVVLADPLHIRRRRRGDKQVFKFADIMDEGDCLMLYL
jgi:hypothetical protein